MVAIACSGSSDKPSGGGTGKAGKASSGKSGQSSTPAGRGGRGGTSGVTGDAGESNGATGGVSATGGVGATGGAFGTGGVAASAGRMPLGGTAGTSIPPGGNGSSGSASVPPGWNCVYSAYGDGTCDCGCNVRDSDCDDNDIDQCERCNITGSCDFRECPGKIDPDNITRCVAPPPEWTCSSFYYDDGECDCGCGAVDADCEDKTNDSCEFCMAFGACSGGACPGPIDPKNNAVCKTPEGWTCLPFFYDDGTNCDCGCGIKDPDCDSASRDECATCWNGCSDEGCPGPIDQDNNAICTGVPGSWTCLARFFNDGVICNCGCGAHDPDCDDETGDSCDSCNFEGSCSKRDCPGTIDPKNNAYCTHPDPPADWTCGSYRYADGYSCDCGCGAIDLDCPDDTLASCTNCSSCGASQCPGLVDPADFTSCTPPPADWECNLYLYGDGYCDCGCGARDPDCKDDLKATCQRCNPYGGSCSPYDCSTILPTNNSLCTDSAPAEWTCPRKFYKDQACDCGCGVRDVDCPSGNLSACKFCNDPGSCSTAAKCAGSTINPTDNAVCTQ